MKNCFRYCVFVFTLAVLIMSAFLAAPERASAAKKVSEKTIANEIADYIIDGHSDWEAEEYFLDKYGDSETVNKAFGLAYSMLEKYMAGQGDSSLYCGNISKVEVGAIADAVYAGKAIEPRINCYDRQYSLRLGTDYKVSYSNNKAVGKATVTITGKGMYSGTKKVTFNILPKNTEITKVTKNSSGKYTIKWNKAKNASSYNVYYSDKMDGEYTLLKSVAAAKKSVTVSGLDKDKEYFFKLTTVVKKKGTKYESVLKNAPASYVVPGKNRNLIAFDPKAGDPDPEETFINCDKVGKDAYLTFSATPGLGKDKYIQIIRQNKGGHVYEVVAEIKNPEQDLFIDRDVPSGSKGYYIRVVDGDKPSRSNFAELRENDMYCWYETSGCYYRVVVPDGVSYPMLPSFVEYDKKKLSSGLYMDWSGKECGETSELPNPVGELTGMSAKYDYVMSAPLYDAYENETKVYVSVNDGSLEFAWTEICPGEDEDGRPIYYTTGYLVKADRIQ